MSLSLRDPEGSRAERQRLAKWVLAGGACLFGAAVTLPAMLAARLAPLSVVAEPSRPARAGSLMERQEPVVPPVTRARGAKMTLIPAGSYRPFYKGSGERGIAVREFLLDAGPVTRAEFLEFVRERPAFRRSAVKRLFAESSYLADWSGDLELGAGDAGAPQTFVSWFAARAYCDHQGKRLPTLIEWEHAAAGDAGVPARATVDPRAPFRFAMAPGGDGAGGDRPAFGSVWEWTLDFNGSLVSGQTSAGDQAVSALFCGAGVRAVDPSDYGAFLRYSFRSSLKADYALKNLGFRCAEDAK
jgi:sulfatase modifying factor 1